LGTRNHQKVGEAGATRPSGSADDITIDGGHGDDGLWGGAGELSSARPLLEDDFLIGLSMDNFVQLAIELWPVTWPPVSLFGGGPFYFCL
jgi:hypothetical protein